MCLVLEGQLTSLTKYQILSTQKDFLHFNSSPQPESFKIDLQQTVVGLQSSDYFAFE